MTRKSTQIALGGLAAAMCLILMFMTGLIPFATYLMPVMAGAMLIPIVHENGRRAALMVYAAVGLLSLLVVPDKEAAAMFVAFFGYYPVIKGKIENAFAKASALLVKLVIFNVAVVGAYALIILVLGMPDLISDFGDFGRYTAVVFIAAGNVIFFGYDVALERYTRLYVRWFKPTFLK
ncbi:hypothetical protein U6B65_00450 [Oscillospiraceae bacterium MB08-C2-2]|nr:hypothetical protein U6B65_00450 [Oscillospiraceae bacterium MB08-C2-2]